MTRKKIRHTMKDLSALRHIILLAIPLLIILSSCEENSEKKYKELEKINAGDPDQVSRNISVRFIDSSFVKAVLTAERGRIFFERKETFVDTNVKVQFYSRESGSRISILTCDSAKIDDRTKNMYAYGRVFVKADSSGTTLTTTFLEWNNSTQKLYSDQFVRISSPSQEIEGYGFESDQKLENYKIFRVTGIKR